MPKNRRTGRKDPRVHNVVTPIVDYVDPKSKQHHLDDSQYDRILRTIVNGSRDNVGSFSDGGKMVLDLMGIRQRPRKATQPTSLDGPSDFNPRTFIDWALKLSREAEKNQEKFKDSFDKAVGQLIVIQATAAKRAK